MNIDLIEFQQAFFEEGRELLEEMETLLLELNLEQPDPERLNAILRIVRSIRNGAATFGFPDTEELTGVLESLFERMRKQEIRLGSSVTDVFFLARDVIASQFVSHRNMIKGDETSVAATCDLLRRLSMTATEMRETPAGSESLVSIDNGHSYLIEFKFSGPQWSLNNLLAQLREFGRVSILSGSTFMHADLVVLDPCVLSVVTSASSEELWESLAFVVDSSTIKVALMEASAAVQPVAVTGKKSSLVQHVSGLKAAHVATLKSVVVNIAATGNLADSSAEKVDKKIRDQISGISDELASVRTLLIQSMSTSDHQGLLVGLARLERNTRDLQATLKLLSSMTDAFTLSDLPGLQQGKQANITLLGRAGLMPI